jgi:phosphatidate cytidylyltransferase
MLTRILSGIVLIPIVLWIILGGNPQVFQVFVLIICLLGAWEWSNFMNLTSNYRRFIYLVLILAGLFFAEFIPSIYILWAGAIWWVYAIGQLIRYHKNPDPSIHTFWMGLLGFLVIIPTWAGLTTLRIQGEHGAGWVLLYLVMLWSTDSGAYLTGKFLGKHKLAPNLSPNKTIEGAIGGFVTLLIVALIGVFILHIPSSQWLIYFIGAILLNVFSVIGDLYESMLKRKRGIKDSGNVIPGHGGILDRIDGLLASIPVFALVVILAGLGA